MNPWEIKKWEEQKRSKELKDTESSNRYDELSQKVNFTKEEAIEFIRMKIDSERNWNNKLEEMMNEQGISSDIINCKFQTLGAIGAYQVALMIIDSIME